MHTDVESDTNPFAEQIADTRKFPRMGADWLKFELPQDADEAELSRLAAFVTKEYPHGHRIVTPPTQSEDHIVRQRWEHSLERLRSLLVFPRSAEDSYWDLIALTDPPGSNVDVVLGGQPRVAPSIEQIEICRVYVISHNPVFPVEWRDEAYRIILPDELPAYYRKWRNYVNQLIGGEWRGYLHELYLFDRLMDEHQSQQFEDLVRSAEQSLTRTNAWCSKERLAPVRERILEFNVDARLKAMQSGVTTPTFDKRKRNEGVTADHLEAEQRFWEIRREAAQQIKEWNRCVPQKWKTQFPIKCSFEDFAENAADNWLCYFFEWCEFLISKKCGLFLWA